MTESPEGKTRVDVRKPRSSLTQRVLVAIVLLPIGLAAIHFGGAAYAVIIFILVGAAAWELAGLFAAGGFRPAALLVVAAVVAWLAARYLEDRAAEALVLAAAILMGATYHVIAYERGRDQAGSDLAVTLAGILYLGGLGGYFLSLRALPDGKWWVLTVLPAVWLADSGAYFIGRRFGRRAFTPRLSPKKTWEGYFGGLAVALVGTALLAALWQSSAGPGTAITPLRGAALGGLLALVTPLGDLTESMIKRQVGKKDSGTLLPGHGGALDRIDSWLWAAPIGYYVIIWFFLPA